jgi:hypothetical protein
MSMRQSAVNEWRSFARTVTRGPERTITSPARPSLRRAIALLALIGATLALTAPSGATTTKSSRELVPAGAHVLYWEYPTTVTTGTSDRTVVVKNLAIIAQVRALINALPLSNTARHACPDDMMLPITVSFAASTSSTPFTRVIFQLGGCPSAEIIQRGSVVLPTLGRPTLSSTYAKIKHLVTS